MLIYLDIKIPHLKIAPLVDNLEVGNLEGIPFFTFFFRRASLSFKFN